MLTVSTKAFVSFCVIAGVAAASSAAVAASAPGNQPAHVDEAYPHNPPPYPDTAQTNGEQGSVILDVKVTSEGKVRNIKVDQSSVDAWNATGYLSAIAMRLSARRGWGG